MKYLVTGGAGFIGAAFVKLLLSKKNIDRVLVLDSLDYAGDLTRLDEVKNHPKLEFHRANVTDRMAVSQAAEGMDALFHFAAQTHVDRSLLSSKEFFDSNTYGTQVLLDAAVEKKVKRFVFVSTDEVYGSKEQGAFTETDPVQPTNPYSVSKAAAEFLVKNTARHDGLSAVITRGSNTYGAFQYPEKVIPLFVSQIIEGQKVPLYGDGGHMRDWLHVDDHADAVYYVYERGKDGETYNIPGNKELTNKELTLRMLKLLDGDEKLINYVKDRKGHDRRYALSGDKLKNLGWSHKKSFDEAFPQVIRWYRDHKSWLEQIRTKKAEFQRYYQQQYGFR